MQKEKNIIEFAPDEKQKKEAIAAFAGIKEEDLRKPFPTSFRFREIEESPTKSATFRAAMKMKGHSVASSFIERILVEYLTKFYVENPKIRELIDRIEHNNE